MEIIINAVKRFFERYPTATTLGSLTTPADLGGLPTRAKNAIPEWYRELLLQFPIANLPLGIPNDFGQPLLQGRSKEQLPLMEITFNSVDKIQELSGSIFPNYLLRRKKIIGIAEDQGSTGEQIFIDTESEDPSPMLIFHDMGESVRDLIRNGEKITEKFSDLFTLGKLRNDRIQLTSENQRDAIILIERFFRLIDDELTTMGMTLTQKLTNSEQLTKSIERRNNAIKDGDYIRGLLSMEYGLEDSGYPLTRDHVDKLKELYKVCNLHIPELVYLEERVSNSGG
jgi:hypothetical protein